MANVAFKKGLRANLPAAKSAGTFYVTTDERAIYLDIDDSSRIRIGDFQEFANVTALEANPNPSTTALYYVADINCLAKWNGSNYVQINRDTGATSFEVTGDGNAVTDVSYDATARKLTLTKGATYAKSGELSALANKVQDLENIGGQTNILEVVKVNGEALVIDANKAVDVLVATGTANGTIAVNGKDVVVKGLGSAAYKNVDAFDAKGDGAAAADVVRGELNTYKEANNAAVSAAAAKGQQGINDAAAALKAAQDAQSTADSKATKAEVLADVAATYATKTALETAEANIRKDFADADTALKSELNTEIAKKVSQTVYDTKMGELDKSIEDLGKEDERLAGLIDDNRNAIETINGRLDNEGGIVDRIETVEAFFASAEIGGDKVIDTLKEIQDYITSDTTGAANLLAAIEANERAIAQEVADRGAADQTINQSITDLSGVVDTKATQADLTALTGRVTTAEGKITTLENGLKDANTEIAKKANASDLTALEGEFDNYVETHASDYTNSVIDEKIKAVADDLDAYEEAHANDYTNAQIDAAIDADVKVAADAAAANLKTVKENLEGRIDAEATARATAITNAIADLDSSIAASDGHALTGITITDGKISAKTEAKFATESYVDTKIQEAQLTWGSF